MFWIAVKFSFKPNCKFYKHNVDLPSVPAMCEQLGELHRGDNWLASHKSAVAQRELEEFSFGSLMSPRAG